MATPISNLSTHTSQENSAENQKILDSVMNEINKQTAPQYSQNIPQHVPMPQPMSQQMHQGPPPMQEYPYGQQKYQQQEQTYNDIMAIAKEPLLIAAIFIILNMSFVNETLAKYIPGMFTVDGTMSSMSLLVRGLLAGVAFFFLKSFIKN